MSEGDCCLTLVLPTSLEEDLVDHLLERPEWVRGFVISQVEGSGQAVVLRGLGELVRGRSRRTQLQLVMRREDAVALVESLRDAFRGAEVFWWLAPVLDSGRLE